MLNALKLALIGGLAMLMASAAASRDLTSTEMGGLADRIASFNAAMEAKDFDGIQSVVSPKIFSHIAEQAGIPVDDLRAAMNDVMAQSMAAVTIESYGMDLDSADVLATEDDQPYVLIPTQSIMSVEGTGRFESKSKTLGLMDDGVWYLVRVEDPQQVLFLRAAYPRFTNVEFPSGSLTALE